VQTPARALSLGLAPEKRSAGQRKRISHPTRPSTSLYRDLYLYLYIDTHLPLSIDRAIPTKLEPVKPIEQQLPALVVTASASNLSRN
jgi:hypothetical protein